MTGGFPPPGGLGSPPPPPPPPPLGSVTTGCFDGLVEGLLDGSCVGVLVALGVGSFTGGSGFEVGVSSFPPDGVSVGGVVGDLVVVSVGGAVLKALVVSFGSAGS